MSLHCCNLNISVYQCVNRLAIISIILKKAIVLEMQPFSLSLFIFCTFVNFHFHKSRSRYRKRDDRGHWAKAMLMKASLIIDLSAGVVTIIPFRLWKEELQFLLIGLKISHETTQNDILKYFRMALQIPCRNNK